MALISSLSSSSSTPLHFSQSAFVGGSQRSAVFSSSRFRSAKDTAALSCVAAFSPTPKGASASTFASNVASYAISKSASPSRSTIAITGGTGFVGRRLVKRLQEEGYGVRILTRNPMDAVLIYPEGSGVELFAPSDWSKGVQGCEGVVNLAGTPISTRWTELIKADIKKSRKDATNNIVSAILSSPKSERPSVLVSSSAVGFYGSSTTASFDESSAPGNDFLSEVCTGWEDAAAKVLKEQGTNKDSGVRLVIVRTGIVLDKDGGALAKMVPIFQLFAGGPLGSGEQWFSWIHRDDLVSLMIEALKNPKFSGVFNGTAPNPVRVSEMCDRLGSTLGRPSWLPVPEFAVKALLGEGASVVLDGQKVLPKRTQEAGFEFKYRYIGDALKAIFS